MRPLLLFLLGLFVPLTTAYADDSAVLRNAQAWLRGTRTLTASFSQTANDGRITKGKMFLARPGNVRFEYEPSVPILIVAKDGWMTLIDYGVAQVQRYPLRSTALSLLIDPTLDLSTLARVVPTPEPGLLALEAKDSKNPQFGTIRLYFAPQNNAPGGLSLSGWTVLDGSGSRTTVQLSEVKANLPVPPSTFSWRDPRPKNLSGKGR